jgi:protein SCO1/2/putative membrane protein
LNVPGWVHVLPHVNASLNAAACVLLVAGLVLIRRGKWKAHACVMVSTFFVSTAFLACYLVYHQALLHYTGSGSRGFPGTGVLRQAYLTMLISHTVLAAFVPILALRMMYLAWRKRWDSHRKLGKWTFPVWLYVSTTGVIIYWVLYHMAVGQGS